MGRKGRRVCTALFAVCTLTVYWGHRNRSETYAPFRVRIAQPTLTAIPV